MKSHTRLATRVTALVTACAFMTSSTAMDMQDLFDNVNAQGNVTSAAAIQGQTMNMLSGGSMFMRMPNKTYNISTFTPPSYSTGCGGIDLFAGGFSFINKEQFVAMLRNIGSNALGYGFKLAIQNLCPTCDNVMQALQATSQAMNRLNIDSCEAAKGIVQAAVPDSWDKDKTNTAKMFGVDGNTFSDVTDAWANIAKSGAKVDKEIEAAQTAKPELKESMPTGNVVWKALKKIPELSKEQREVLLSMTGTTVFPLTPSNAEDSPGPKVYPRKEIGIKTLIGGNKVNNLGEAMDTIELPVWTCTEEVDCLIMEPKIVNVKSIRSLIGTKMAEIMKKMATRQAYSNADETMQFLSTTDIPIYKILAVGTSMGNTAQAQNLVNRYQELLAAKYAEAWINRSVHDLRIAIETFKSEARGPAQAEALESLMPTLESLNEEARSVMVTAYTQTISTYNITLEVAHMERAMTSNLSGTLRASLAFGKSLN